MKNNNAELMTRVTEEIAHSIMPRVQGLIALLDGTADVEDDEDIGAAFNILQDVQRDLQEAHERVHAMSTDPEVMPGRSAHGMLTGA